MKVNKLVTVLLSVLLLSSLFIPAISAAQSQVNWVSPIDIKTTGKGLVFGKGNNKVTLSASVEYQQGQDTRTEKWNPKKSLNSKTTQTRTTNMKGSGFELDFYVEKDVNEIKFDLYATKDVSVAVTVSGEDNGFYKFTQGKLSVNMMDVFLFADDFSYDPATQTFYFTMDAGERIDPLIAFNEVAGTYLYDDIANYAPGVVLPAAYAVNQTIHPVYNYAANTSTYQDWQIQMAGNMTTTGNTTEFEWILENLRDEWYSGLTDTETSTDGQQHVAYDESATYWDVDVGSTKTNETGIVVRGVNSTKVLWDAAAEGDLFHEYGAQDIDITNFTFVEFWFKGNNSGASINLDLLTNGDVDVIRRSWIDDSVNWTKWQFALYNFTEVGGSWDNVIAAVDEIRFWTDEAASQGTTMYFDRFFFDNPIWVPSEFYIGDNTTSIEVYNLDSTGADPRILFEWDVNGTTDGSIYPGNLRNLEDEWLGVIAKQQADDWTLKANSTLQAGAVGTWFVNTTTWLTDTVDKMAIPADYVNDDLINWNQEWSIGIGNHWDQTRSSVDNSSFVGMMQINNATDATLHLLAGNYATNATQLTNRGAPMAWDLNTALDRYSETVIVDNDRQETNNTLLDNEVDAGLQFVPWDDNPSWWDTFSDGAGAIALGAPTYDVGVKEKGNQSMQVNIIGGGDSQIITGHDYGLGTEIDLSDYPYFSFWMWGNNSAAVVKVFLTTTGTLDGPSDFVRWDIPDDFNGWRRVTVAINNPDGTVGAFDNSTVRNIRFSYTPGVNNDELRFDRISFDNGQWVYVETTTPDSFGAGRALSLEAWNGTAFNQYLNWDAAGGNVTSTLAELVFLDGTTGADIRGGANVSEVLSGYFNNQRDSTIGGEFAQISGQMTTSKNYGGFTRSGFAVKMPPDSTGFDSVTDGISQAQIRYNVTYGNNGVSVYEFNDDDNEFWGLEHINGSAITLFGQTADSQYLTLITNNDVDVLRLVANENQTILGYEFNVTGTYKVLVDTVDDPTTSIVAPTGENILELSDRWNGYYENIAQFDRGQRASVDVGEGDEGFGWTYTSFAGLDNKVAIKVPLAPWQNATTVDVDSGRSQMRLRAVVNMANPSTYSYTVDFTSNTEANFVLTLLSDFFRDSYNIGPDRAAGAVVPMLNNTITFTDPRTATQYNLTYVSDVGATVAERQNVQYMTINGTLTRTKVIPLGPITSGLVQNITVQLGNPIAPTVDGVASGNLTAVTWDAANRLMVVTMNRGTGVSTVTVDTGGLGAPNTVTGALTSNYDAATDIVTLTLNHPAPGARQSQLRWTASPASTFTQLAITLVSIFLLIAIIVIFTFDIDDEDRKLLITLLIVIAIAAVLAIVFRGWGY